MKKILLVGALNEVIRSVNECLADQFQVQLCSLQLDNIKGMVKIYRPNLLIICQIGVDEIDSSIYEWLNLKADYIPTLIITSREVWNALKPYCENRHYETLFRPITSQAIVMKCNALLAPDGESDPDKDNVEESVMSSVKPDRLFHILVVDDNPMVLRNIKGILEKHYDVTLAKSGEAALKLIEKKRPDLVLLDYLMPGMDGKETFDRILEMENGILLPVVFLTGVSEKQKILAVLKNRPAGYVLKPPDREKLVEEIERILSEYYNG